MSDTARSDRLTSAQSGSLLTTVTVLDPDQIERVYAMYRAAFAPMQGRAAARHMLTLEEFTDEARDERIVKYLAWRDGVLVGVTALAVDLHAVPWISPQFYSARYPDEAARGAFFYLMFTLVDPSGADTYRVFQDMMYAVCGRFARERGVVGADFSDYNSRGAVGRIVRLMPRLFGALIEEVDVHTHYAWTPNVADVDGEMTTEVLDRQHYWIGDFRNATDKARQGGSR